MLGQNVLNHVHSVSRNIFVDMDICKHDIFIQLNIFSLQAGTATFPT
jgi:hypothetical protein